MFILSPNGVAGLASATLTLMIGRGDKAGGETPGGLIIVPALKVLRIVALLATVSACSTFGGGGGEAVLPNELEATHARANALEVEVTRLKSENARLSNQVLELRRENETLVAENVEARESNAPELKDGPGETPVVIASARPQPQENAVVDSANAPELEQSDVPVEEAPRLVQPSFASTEAVFENEADSDEIETASVLFGVHLASYRNMPEAREGWQKLQRENPDELGLLEPRVETVTLTEKGVFMRLIGGGFSSQDKASALCANLKQKGLFCAVSSFNGDRLSLADAR